MSTSPPKALAMPPFTRPPKHHYLSYRIARGEQGVLTYEPYKSHLLHHWRFRTPQLARTSAEILYQHFLSFFEQADFVGMDMARKFIQMGMTRAKRYANYAGGRKYAYEDGQGGKKVKVQREKSEGHVGREGKEEASMIFRAYWGRCTEHEGYQRLKKEFLKEQKEWEGLGKKKVKVEEDDEVKIKDNNDDEVKIKEEEEVRQPAKKKCKTNS
ncbi:hypothetical protein LHYA1_G005727 [Lachnellula hyalina]|uniref:Uncharacterized protein n=1 Tax=Lachnellula hyalina TaxID=1316788 RepID=A0A8H8QZ33_9HELO|nr:uncharacterized protein LHYA1_G005727 [Lachnellula hyalina]TVY25483.1 hypothetical protein LHYA1_G005727 [Lachnellula hyalina]